MLRPRVNTGFTLIELLIVIVVIAILAAISVVAYSGIQARTRDSMRRQDMKTIVQALEVYKIDNGRYPATINHGGVTNGGWEITTDGTDATNFISALSSGDTPALSSVPIDPVNKGTSYRVSPSNRGDAQFYFYYRYAPGAAGCDASKGGYYVLGVTTLEGVPKGETSPDSPGFACGTRDWSDVGAWVTGRFENG